MVKIDKVLPDPDMVGESEYRAIFECIVDALEDAGGGVSAFFSGEAKTMRLSPRELKIVVGMAEQFRDHAQAIIDKVNKLAK